MKTAIIGCGAVTQLLYVNALKKLSGNGLIDVSAIVDPNPIQRAAVQEHFPRAIEYNDIESMLKKDIAELAIIATPHRFHSDMTIKCLEKGIHVLCEKPMANSIDECRHMIAAADKNSKLLAVGHFRRFFPSCIIIKNILESKMLGLPKSFRIIEGDNYSWPAKSASFFKRQDAGGGVLIDAGAHTIDLLIWWLGEPEEICYYDDAMGGIETNCRIYLSMSNNVKGTVILSRDWSLENRYIIDCEKGWIVYNCDIVDKIEWGFHNSSYGLQSGIYCMNQDAVKKLIKSDQKTISFRGCFESQILNIINTINGKEKLYVSGKEAIKTIAFIENCYKNKKLINMEWLSKEEIKNAEILAYGK